MKKTYNKLVRDHIPDIIRANGKESEIDVMGESEYREALLIKLVEEAQEAAQSRAADLASELADLYEVMDAILVAWDIQKEEVRSIQANRRELRGGFERRLKLLWVE